MTEAIPNAPVGASSLAQRAGRLLQQTAAAVLLCIVVARAFVGELPFRTPLLNLPAGQTAEGDRSPVLTRADRGELARVSFACLLLAAVTIWLLGSAFVGRLAMRHGKLAGLIGLFAVLSLASALMASDKRSAMDVWLEQLAVMLGGFLAVQCLTDRRSLWLLAAALAAVGGVLATKGVHQVLVEIPQTVEYWKAYVQHSSLTGPAMERAFEARVRATTPTGFFGLSNLLASLLIVCLLAAAGLATEKFYRALADRRAWQVRRTKGEVHTPTLAAALMALLAVAVAAALILTRSRGGILAAIVAVIAWAVLLRWREALAGQWRQAVATIVVLFLIGCAGVVAYGLRYDRLPSKSMTFRWYYWTGAAGMVEDHPWLGVGPGNFASAYLHYRRPAAEETVKLPHNSIAEAVSQYGVLGGLAYLAAVAVVLVGMCRPRAEELPPTTVPVRWWPWALALALTVGVTRWLFSDAGADPTLFFLDGVLPAVLLGILLLVAVWAGRGFAQAAGDSLGAVRVALACGVAGIFLHGMVEFSLSMPAVATVFWIVGGSCLGSAGGSKLRNISSLRWVLAANAAVLTLAASWIFWRPVYCRTMLTELAMRYGAHQDIEATAHIAYIASLADPLDGYAAADAARAAAAVDAPPDSPEGAAVLGDALRWAQQAMDRDKAYYGHAELAAEIAWRQGGTLRSTALDTMARAVELNPMDHRLRLRAAAMYIDAGKASDGLREIQAAEEIDAALYPESLMRFDTNEQKEIRMLKARAAALSSMPASRPARQGDAVAGPKGQL